MDLDTLDTLARWLHVVSVLFWVGHNYVNVVLQPVFRPVEPNDPPEALRDAFMAALKREHAVFRHASLVAWATGLIMLWHRDLALDAFLLSGDAVVLGIGVWTGTIMVLNLWLVMWPHQKKVLGFVPATTEERVRCSRITFLSSRTNTILSFPTIFFMVTGAHAPFLFGG
jgi:uncharacterized membrane protein